MLVCIDECIFDNTDTEQQQAMRAKSSCKHIAQKKANDEIEGQLQGQVHVLLARTSQTSRCVVLSTRVGTLLLSQPGTVDAADLEPALFGSEEPHT